MKLISRSVILLPALIFVLYGTAAASDNGPPLPVAETYDLSENVIVVKVNSIKPTDLKLEPWPDAKADLAYVTVVKVYKGNLKPGQELVFVCKEIWIGGARPHVGLAGTTTLLYLDGPRPDGYWEPNLRRGGRIDHAAADILYLDKMEELRGKTRLSGRLVRRLHFANETRWEFLEGWSVRITGEGKEIDLTTGKNGVYEVYDLPPGKYRVEPGPVPGYKATTYYSFHGPDNVTVSEGKQTEMLFDFVVDNSIRGRVVDKKGVPLAHAQVVLVPVGDGSRPYALGLWSEANGSFALDTITPGTYLLAVNPGNKPTAFAPYSPSYYPDTGSPGKAVPVTIGPGSHLKDIEIKVQEVFEILTIRGIVLDIEGKPVKSFTSVRFFEDPNDFRAQSPMYTADADVFVGGDRSARFSLNIVKGRKGIIFAAAEADAGKFLNCAEAADALKAKKGFFLASQRVEISAESGIEDLELRLQMPACKSPPSPGNKEGSP